MQTVEFYSIFNLQNQQYQHSGHKNLWNMDTGIYFAVRDFYSDII
jgi:hypothetical protein